MTIFGLSLALGLPWLLGVAVVALSWRDERLALPTALGLGFGIGFGILAQWMLLLGIAGIPLRALTVGAPVAAAAAISLALLIRRRVRKAAPFFAFPRLRPDPLILLMLVCLAAYAAYAFWRAFAFPVYAWDAVATISMKAKVIFFDGTLASLPRFNHSAYPLHVPFVQAWIAMATGEWNDHLVKAVFPVTAVCYGLVQYAFVQSFAGARWAVFSLLLLTLSPLFVHHTTVSYRDLTMLYFNCTTVLLSLWWFQTKRLRLLLLAAFFSGFTTFVKIEGMGFLPCYSAFVLVMLLASRELSWLEKVRAQLLFTGIGVAIWAIYASYKSSLGVVDGARYEITFGKEALMRVPAIIDAFTKNMFTSGNWSVVFGLFALSLLRFRRIWRDKLVLFSAMACLMFLAFYSLIAMLSPNFVYLAGADMSKGLARVFLHFWGLVPVAVVLINGREVCHDISDPH